MRLSISLAVLGVLLSGYAYGSTLFQSEQHRQEGFQAAQAMYDACIEEAEETQGEAERTSNDEYIHDCVSSIDAQDHAGYIN